MIKGIKIRELLEEGKPYSYISAETGCALSTISYHAKILGKNKCSYKQITYDWNKIQSCYDSGYSISDLTREFGPSHGSVKSAAGRGDFQFNYNKLERGNSTRKRRRELIKSGVIPNKSVISDELLFVENSKSTRTTLKKRIISNNILKYCCSNKACSLFSIENPVWAGQIIVLHLDHINGVRNDNRIENLRFLCPNCHSQTETYCGKNINVL
jgi:hypothetical protein